MVSSRVPPRRWRRFGPVARRRFAPWLLLALLSSAAFGADVNPIQAEPGFVDFDGFKLFTRDELDVHISVRGPLLALVAGATKESDPELSKALGALQGVEVRAYTVGEGNRDSVHGELEKMADRLRETGWSTAMTVKVDRDHGYAMLRFKKGQESDPVGLVAMYLTESNEAVFVNIVGDIDTRNIGRLARRFDLDLLAVDGESAK
ncbi:MAG: DUF4252 domain-containing protein [Acidobacteriota bacterium]